jgi:type III restriction enzyme
MKDKEKLLSFEHAAEVHLLALGAEGRLGQPQRLPDLQLLREMAPSASVGRPSAAACACASTRKGERLRGFEVNTLTVIATESYEQFAENLQKEIEADTGIRFGIVEQHQFAASPEARRRRLPAPLGFEQSKPCGST